MQVVSDGLQCMKDMSYTMNYVQCHSIEANKEADIQTSTTSEKKLYDDGTKVLQNTASHSNTYIIAGIVKCVYDISLCGPSSYNRVCPPVTQQTKIELTH